MMNPISRTSRMKGIKRRRKNRTAKQRRSESRSREAGEAMSGGAEGKNRRRNRDVLRDLINKNNVINKSLEHQESKG
jgi:hypothetical protein